MGRSYRRTSPPGTELGGGGLVALGRVNVENGPEERLGQAVPSALRVCRFKRRLGLQRRWVLECCWRQSSEREGPQEGPGGVKEPLSPRGGWSRRQTPRGTGRQGPLKTGLPAGGPHSAPSRRCHHSRTLTLTGSKGKCLFGSGMKPKRSPAPG